MGYALEKQTRSNGTASVPALSRLRVNPSPVLCRDPNRDYRLSRQRRGTRARAGNGGAREPTDDQTL